jgi:CBS domain-containing protein
MARGLRAFLRMKIFEIMTSDPEFCAAGDSVIDAALIMARRGVGLVPIVESVETRKAIGCITDRDIVVRVVAEGRDPNLIASLSEVMTQEICTCSPNDDVDDVRKLMEQRQIRRVMVTDERGSLVGIIATADLATSLDNKEKVGETLEQISEP